MEDNKELQVNDNVSVPSVPRKVEHTNTDTRSDQLGKGPGRPVGSRSTRQEIRRVAFLVIDDPRSNISQLLHATDQLLLLIGLGSRTSAGRGPVKAHVNKKAEKKSAMRTQTTQPASVQQSMRDRLEEMMSDVSMVSNEEADHVE